MNEIQIFTSPEFGNIRIVATENNEPLFCAADVCAALGYANARKAVSDHVEEDDVTKRYTIDNLGRQQNATFVTESGLYSLIFGSKLDNAKKFKRWVTSEVLPAIRKGGGYMADKGNETAEELMARALNLAQETLKRREERLRQLAAENDVNRQTIQLQTKELKEAAPKVTYCDNVLQSVNSMTTASVANGIGMTANALNKKLIAIGIAYRNHDGQILLRQPYLGWGLHDTRTYTYTRSDGSIGTRVATVWTERGRRYIHALKDYDYDTKKANAYLKGKIEMPPKM